MIAVSLPDWPADILAPLPVALPLVACATMLAVAHYLPPRRAS